VQNKQIGYYFIVMASVMIVLAGIKSASVIVVPFLLSLFIAIILSPSYNYFNKKGVPSGISLLIVVGFLVVFFTFVGKLLGSSIIEFNSNLGFYEEQLKVHFHNFVELSKYFGIDIPESDMINIFNPKTVMSFASSIVQSMGSLFTNGFVILLTVVFMLLESKNFIKKITNMNSSSDTQTIVHITSILTKIKEYMVIKALISLLTGFIIYIGLLSMGIDYPFLWAVVAFLLNFIPNIGSIIAAVPAVLLTLVQLGTFSALMVGVIYVVVNVVVGSIIEPKIMGKGLGLSTLVVFLSLLFWGWLLGTVGMLLSIPLTIMAKIVLDANQNTKWISILLGSSQNVETNNK